MSYYAVYNWIWPLAAANYSVTQGFGGSHAAVDLAVPDGTPVYAPQSGQATGYNQSDGFGIHVRLVTVDGYEIILAHLSSQPGDSTPAPVGQGNLIGYSGSTGNSSGPHLHYEIRGTGGQSSIRLDPMAEVWYYFPSPSSYPPGGPTPPDNGTTPGDTGPWPPPGGPSDTPPGGPWPPPGGPGPYPPYPPNTEISMLTNLLANIDWLKVAAVTAGILLILVGVAVLGLEEAVKGASK